MSEPITDPKAVKEDFSFGQICIRERLATLDQVKEGLDLQARLRAIGIEPMKLGEILIEKGYLKREQAERVLTIQREALNRTAKIAVPGYEILDKIGQGAMGAVYRARQVSMDRIVAIKVLSPKHGRDEKYVDRFLNEARSVAKLNHENVISGIDVGSADGVHYFVMEHVDGTTVAKIMDQEKRIDEKRCLQIAQQICRALDHAHRHGILHRDVKPENIMITSDGIAKLCDLGLAKQASNDATATSDGLCVGTPNYISPEQARGEQNLDIRTDIYSLGASLYHMATGKTPFDGPNPMAVMTKHVTEFAPPVRKINPALTEGFSALVTRMMAKLRNERHQTPLEVIADIEKLLKGETVAAAPGTPKPATGRFPAPARPAGSPGVARAQRQASQTSTYVGVAAAVVVAVILLMIVRSVLSSGPDPGPVTPGPRGEDAEAQRLQRDHDDRMSAYRAMRDEREKSDAADQLTGPYARIEENIAEFRNKRQEAAWRDELQSFVKEMDASVLSRAWKPIRAEIDNLVNAGQLRTALARATDEFPERYRYFKRGAPEVTTAAERERRETVKLIETKIADKFAADKAEAEKLGKSGRVDDALRMIEEMLKSAAPDRTGDLRSLRETLVVEEITAMTKDPLTPAKLLTAAKRLDDLHVRYRDDDAFVRFVDAQQTALKRRVDEANSGLTQRANEAYARFEPAFRRALTLRDLPAARREIDQLFKNESLHDALGGDLGIVGEQLGRTTVEGSKVARVAEDVFKRATTNGRTMVAELALDVREWALLEELLALALQGADRSPKGVRGLLPAPYADATEVKAAARKSPDAPFQVEIVSPARATVWLSPPTKPALDEQGIVALAAKSGPADAHTPLRRGLLYFYAGEGLWSLAKQELSAAADVPTPTLARYLTKLANTASAADEKDASDTWTKARGLWTTTNKKKLDELRGHLEKLLSQLAHTTFMRETQPDGRSRAAHAKARLDQMLGASGTVDPKKKGPFAAKSVKADKDLHDITYDFSTQEALGDFTQEALVQQVGAATWTFGERAVQGDGSGILQWKAPVTGGDLQVDLRIRARDNKNVGVAFPSTGLMNAGEGYLAWFGFANQASAVLRSTGWPAHPIIDLPWRDSSARVGDQRNGEWKLQQGREHALTVIRRGKAVQIRADGVVLTEGTITGDVTPGRIGVALWASKVTLLEARFQVAIDPAWLAEQTKEPPK